MKLGWLMFQYAPPELKLTAVQRREARRRTWKNYRSTLTSLLISFATACVLGVLWGAAPLLVFDPTRLGPAYAIVLLTYPFVFALISWPILAYAGKWIYGTSYRTALNDMGFHVCVKCGYWLRGLDDAVKHCPECGAARERIADDTARHVR